MRKKRRGNNVVQFSRRKLKKPKFKLAQTKLDLSKLSPLWLVAIAAVLVVIFKFYGNTLNPGISIDGSVTHVRDGDTIVVSGTPIRFAKLDCAELGTTAGERAKNRMKALVGMKRLSCRLTGRKSYDRMIGECDLHNGQNISEVMIDEGYCKRWW